MPGKHKGRNRSRTACASICSGPTNIKEGDFVLMEKIWPVKVRRMESNSLTVYSRSDKVFYKILTSKVDSMKFGKIDWKTLAQKKLKRKPDSYRLWVQDVEWAERGGQDDEDDEDADSNEDMDDMDIDSKVENKDGADSNEDMDGEAEGNDNDNILNFDKDTDSKGENKDDAEGHEDMNGEAEGIDNDNILNFDKDIDSKGENKDGADSNEDMDGEAEGIDNDIILNFDKDIDSKGANRDDADGNEDINGEAEGNDDYGILNFDKDIDTKGENGDGADGNEDMCSENEDEDQDVAKDDEDEDMNGEAEGNDDYGIPNFDKDIDSKGENGDNADSNEDMCSENEDEDQDVTKDDEKICNVDGAEQSDIDDEAEDINTDDEAEDSDMDDDYIPASSEEEDMNDEAEGNDNDNILNFDKDIDSKGENGDDADGNEDMNGGAEGNDNDNILNFDKDIDSKGENGDGADSNVDMGSENEDGDQDGEDMDKCKHEEPDEGLIERDKDYRGIYVRKQLKSNRTQTGLKKKSSRVYNNYHCCFLCRKHTTNILKHLRTHRDNNETREIIEMKKSIDAGNSQDKIIKQLKQNLTKKQTLLRCRGDHQHNMDVKKSGSGELLIARKQGQFKVKDYGPCPLCFEWLKIESFSKKHQINCPARKICDDESRKEPVKQLTKGEAITQSAVLVGIVSEKASKSLIKEVYPIMTRDDTTVMAKGDALIVALGNNWLRRNIGNKLKRKYYTSSRMRGAARLLKHLHDLSEKKLPMVDYINPMYFDIVCEAALLCANVDNDDEEDLASPSSALKIGFDIGRLAQLKLGIAIREGNKTSQKEAEQFTSLMKLEWTLKVSKLAHMKLNDLRLKKTTPLPVPEDLAAISKHLKTELALLDFSRRPSDQDQTNVTYNRAVILTQTRLLTYNKRRSGELEALSMENYENRSIGLEEADRALLGNDLTDLEKHLIDSQQLIKIRGKNSKPVPILVPEDVVPALEYITSPNVRRTAGVKTWNKFVFANAGENVFRAYDSLKMICGEISLSAPERITSVSMRKYIATLSQVIDMKEHELEWLCGHLGHTADIHKLHYRATSGFIERVNIGKLMLLQDLNLAGKYAGKRLQDIDINDVVKGVSPSQNNNTDENSGALDEDVFEDESKDKRQKNSSYARKKWTKDEEEEIKILFQEQMDKKKNPGIKECMAAIKKSRDRKGLIYLRNWETIKKKVMRMVANQK